MQFGIGSEVVRAPHRALIAFVVVVIGVDVRPIANQHEEVAMAAVREACAGLLAERLPYAEEPRLGIFPGRVVAVELVGAEGVIHVGHGEVRGAPGAGETGGGCQLQVAVIAIGDESRGKIAGERKLLRNGAEDAGQRPLLLIDAVIAHRRPQAQFRGCRRLGNHVDDAAHGIRAIHRGAGTVHHFDARHRIERHGDVHVVMAGLRIVQPQPVQQYESLGVA